jgi:hypothetical protein
MGYQDAVEQKLTQAGERLAERSAIWKRIASAYQRGLTDQVIQELNAEADDMKKQFDRLFRALEKTL